MSYDIPLFYVDVITYPYHFICTSLYSQKKPLGIRISAFMNCIWFIIILTSSTTALTRIQLDLLPSTIMDLFHCVLWFHHSELVFYCKILLIGCNYEIRYSISHWICTRFYRVFVFSGGSDNIRYWGVRLHTMSTLCDNTVIQSQYCIGVHSYRQAKTHLRS